MRANIKTFGILITASALILSLNSCSRSSSKASSVEKPRAPILNTQLQILLTTRAPQDNPVVAQAEDFGDAYDHYRANILRYKTTRPKHHEEKSPRLTHQEKPEEKEEAHDADSDHKSKPVRRQETQKSTHNDPMVGKFVKTPPPVVSAPITPQATQDPAPKTIAELAPKPDKEPTVIELKPELQIQPVAPATQVSTPLPTLNRINASNNIALPEPTTNPQQPVDQSSSATTAKTIPKLPAIPQAPQTRSESSITKIFNAIKLKLTYFIHKIT